MCDYQEEIIAGLERWSKTRDLAAEFSIEAWLRALDRDMEKITVRAIALWLIQRNNTAQSAWVLHRMSKNLYGRHLLHRSYDQVQAMSNGQSNIS